MAEIHAETRPGFTADMLASRQLAVQRGPGGRLVVVATDGLVVAQVLAPNQRVIDALRTGRRYTGHVHRALRGSVVVLRVQEAT